MPEGHTIHRHARLHRALLVDRWVGAWSPQGRFTTGAAQVDGARVRDVEAHGRLLFYRFVANGGIAAHDLSLHIHLGLVRPVPPVRLGPADTDRRHAARAVDPGRGVAAREADRVASW